MTHWKRYAAVLIALSVPALAGCGHSQDTGTDSQAGPPSAAQKAAVEQAGKDREQAAEARAQAGGANAHIVQQQGQAAASAAAAKAQQNAPK